MSPRKHGPTPAQGRLLDALRRGPGTVDGVRERAHDGATPDAIRERLRRMEDAGWVRRSDEAPDGSHVWQLTQAGRREAARYVAPAEPHDSHGPHETTSHPNEDVEL